MIVTEREAKTKFCPHMRGFHVDGGSAAAINSRASKELEGQNELVQCVASKCMMWINNNGKDTGRCGLAYAGVTDGF